MKEQFLLFFQHSSNPTLLANLSGEILAINPVTEKLFVNLNLENNFSLIIKNYLLEVKDQLLRESNLIGTKEIFNLSYQLKINLIDFNNEKLVLIIFELSSKSINSLNQELENLDKFIQELVHELKSPLVTIAGFANVLQEDYKEVFDEQGLNYLESILRGTRRLDNKLMALMELTKITSKIKRQDLVDFKELLQETCFMLKSVIEKRNPQIITITDLPTIICNRSLIKKAISNLILNAVIFTPLDRSPVIEIGCKKDSTKYLFWIKDNAVGIEEKLQKRVFELFYRSKTLPKVDGIGSGLSLVDRIITVHDGKIWVESTPNLGSCFYFSLPIRNSFQE
ncbi:MAG: hypothetical protein J0M03_07770 [Acidobacteria bacterium]|nr:hypothetical protein [Acidobacteriota bacterium]